MDSSSPLKTSGMKANLRSKDGSNIALCGVETTVGREDTDIILRVSAHDMYYYYTNCIKF